MSKRKYSITPLREKPDEYARTICDVHRDVYRLAERIADPEIALQLRDLAAEGYDMGKRMTDRLVWYKRRSQ